MGKDAKDQELLKNLADLSPEKRALLAMHALRLKKSDEHARQNLTIPKIERQPGSSALPLSYAQQRLWFLYQMNPLGDAYNVPSGVHLVGQLDIPALEKSLGEIVRRHEVLRTAFGIGEGQPVQIIQSDVSISLPVIDLSHVAGDERQAEVQKLFTAEASKPFDLSRSPLLRTTLLRLAEQEHIVLLTMHHIVRDGWSRSILIREVSQLYGAFAKGQPSPLAELPIQYADYAVWQRTWLQGEVLDQHLAFWREQLGGTLPTLELPSDRPRQPVQSFRGAVHQFSLSPSLSAALKQLSQREGVTLYMTLCAAYKTLLHRYTGQQDIIVGTPIAGRDRGETEGLIGFFVNTLALRTDMSGNPTFRELLARVRKVTLGAFANQNLPFQKLVEELQPERNLSRNPIVQVMFTLHNTPLESLEMEGLQATPVQAAGRAETYDELNLMMIEAEDRLHATLEYQTDLFDAPTIESMSRHFISLLEGIVADPATRVADLPLLTPAERHQIAVEWNRTAADYTENVIHEIFEAQAARTPGDTALVFGDVSLSYAELNARANQLARYLRAQGVGADVPVGLCVERSVEMLVGVLGILKAGGAYVPLDPTYPKDRLTLTLKTSASPVIVTTHNLREIVSESGARIINLDTDWPEISLAAGDNLASCVSPLNLGYIIFTSGSTGTPKGVALHQGALVNLINWYGRNLELDHSPRTLQFASINFDVSFEEMFTTWSKGGTLFLLTEAQRRDPEVLFDLIDGWAINRMFCPVVILQQLALTFRQRGDGTASAPRSLRQVVTAGSQLQITDEIKRFFRAMSQCELNNHYGPSETHTMMHYPVGRASDDWEALPPIGRPFANTELYVLDERGELLPAGVPGELHIGGAQVGRGYWNRPDLTADKFIPDPFSARAGARLYRTGDLVRSRRDGCMEWLGRIDHQVKIRGFRVELGEIESLLRGHAGVEEVVVVVRTDTPGEQRLVAYIVPTAAAPPQIAEVRDMLKAKLPEYMVPASFVMLDALPLTPSKKIDRRALPPPAQTRPELNAALVEPRTPSEKLLADIWCDVLKLEQVGIQDNFLELGGDSILSIQVVSRANLAGLPLTLTQVWEHQTIAAQSAAIAELAPVNPSPLKVSPPQETRRGRDAARTPADFPLTRLDQPTLDRLLAEHPALEDVYTLSPMQQGIMFHSLLNPATGEYVEQFSSILRGQLNVEAFRQAWQQVMERHTALRTSFVWEGLDEALQIVHETATLPFEQFDWRELSPADQRARLDAFLEEEILRGRFDLSAPPLMRLFLFRLGEEIHHFVWSFHDTVVDGWSVPLILEEVSAGYEALCRDARMERATVYPYRNFIEWQRSQDHSGAETYWRHVLEGFTEPTPIARPMTAKDSSARAATYRQQRVSLPNELMAALQTLARQQQLTLNTLMQGAWALLLHRFTGNEDVLFGSVVSGRPADLPGVESTVGAFINTLPVRARVPREGSLVAWLKELQAQQIEARRYEFTPLVQIQRWSRIPHGRRLFESILDFINFPAESERFWTEKDWHLQKSGYPLFFVIRPGAEPLLEITYGSLYFTDDAIRQMLNYFQMYLEMMADDAGQSITRFDLLTREERDLLLNGWNETTENFPLDTCFHQLFEAQAERTPDRVAVRSAGRRLTYSELNRRANRLARALVRRGVGADVVVALLAERGIDFLTAMIAVFKAGGAYLPIDPLSPPGRVAQVLERSAASLVLASNEFMTKLEDGREGEPPGGAFEVLALEDLLDETESEENLDAQAAPGNLAYVIFTSGSTGVPKGAMIEHRGMLNHLFAKISELRLTSADVIAQTASQSFDISVWQFLAALLVGGRVHVFGDEVAHDPARLLESVELHNVTILEVVPSLMRVMLDDIARHPSARPSLASLRWLIPTGEALPPDLCMRWFEFYPHVPLLNAYGPTECSDDVTHYPIKTSPDDSLNIPIGMPVANMRLYVLDEQWQPVPVGVDGELCVGGVGVGRGYLRDVASTAKAFIPDSFSDTPGVRLYRTGDKARRRHDGQIEFLGRLDYQVKVRGFRIELGEIETVLAQHASVGQAIVVAGADAVGGQRLVAYVVPAHGKQADDSQLREYLQVRLPDYMIPAHFVKLDALPLTPNGKIDRQALPQPEHLAASDADYAAPRTPVEERLARIWTEVLGVERVGIDDNFFGLGGHSLLATQVISRIRQSLGLEVALHKIFELPTVGTLAGEIETAMRENSGPQIPPLVPHARDERVPLSYAQQRLWFLDRLEPGNTSYNIHTTVRLKGRLDIPALELTLAEIIRRHEVLRTTFPDVDGQPVQAIAPAGEFKLPLLDLSEMPEATREAEVRRTTRDEARRPFNLPYGPLLRARLLRLTATEHVVLFTMHHIISDGWSMGVLTNEIAALYDSFSQGLPSPLAELPVQYADYAVWQRRWLQGDVLERELEYWTLQLAGAPPVLQLPTDRPRAAGQSRPGKAQSLKLSKELTGQLNELCRREGVTLFMTLLAGFNALLSRYAGENDIVVGTPIAGRNRAETENLIGFFVNTLALRTDLSGEPSFRELLGRVREVCLGGYAHQEVPFERLVEELQVERSLDHAPLFQVMFSLQNAPMESFELPGIEINTVATENPMAKFDMLLNTAEIGGQVVCHMQYSTDLFNDSTMSRLLKHFERLLEAAATNPEQSVSRLPLLSDEERAAELWGWNLTQSEYPESSCFQHLFEQQAARTPDMVAVSYRDETLTYAELNSRADALARHLQSMGVAPDHLVGILAQRSIEMPVALLGVLKAGAAYVPLDPTNPTERLAYILRDAGVKLLLTQEHLAGSLQEMNVPVVLLDAGPSVIEPGGQDDAAPLAAEVDADNLAYVIYTSGSTGKPKGTLITHRGLVNYLFWCVEAYALETGSIAPVHSSISFDLTVTGLLAPLLVGGQVELLPEDVGIEALVSAVRSGRAYGLIKLTPTQMELLAQRITPEEAAQCTRAFIVGGEQLSFDALRFWRQHAPMVKVVNEYGPTETVVGCCVYEVASDGNGSAAVPVGHPIANTRIYLLDANLESVPRGVTGELYISGPGVARGYLNRADLTAENFLPDPFLSEPGARMYRSGDLARRLPEGEIEFIQRRDSQVKIRGFRVEFGEIEAALRRCRGVLDSAAMLRRKDDGEQSQLVAYFVAPEEDISAATLRESLGEMLPDYMIPTHFVRLDALPLTPNGKTDRKALPAPDQITSDAESFVEPRTPVEETLARIWAEVLEVERVSATDNFFELGGHSLLATQITSRMQAAFGVEVPLTRLFELPTLELLAEFIESAIFDAIEEMPEATVEELVNKKPSVK